MERNLLRTDPDRIVSNRSLAKFAVDRARPLYARDCAACHADLHGNPAKGIPDLTDGEWLYGAGSVAEIERTITYGIRSGRPKSWNLADMPGYGRALPYARFEIPSLTPGEIRDVVQHILSIQGRPSDTDASRRGAELFAGKGICFDCHSNDGEGDSAIGAPSLISTVRLYGDDSPEALFNSIARGHRGICPGWSKGRDPVGIRALAVYVYFASHPAERTASSE